MNNILQLLKKWEIREYCFEFTVNEIEILKYFKFEIKKFIPAIIQSFNH